MGELRHLPRRRYERGFRRSCLLLSCLFLGSLAVLLALLQAIQWSASRNTSTCHGPASSVTAISPDVMFIALVDSTSALHSLRGLDELDFAGQTCIFRLYTSSEREYRLCIIKFENMCVAKRKNCRIEVRYLSDMRMWGDIVLDDVSKRTMVVFLRHSVKFTSRAMDWLNLAHTGIENFYAAGGRRDYVGAAIGCYGEKSLSPWWSHAVGPLNTTCAFSPVRKGREDLWVFFSQWFRARRREWVSWPHIWEEEIAVPTFWKGKTRTKRDRKLIKFGQRVGKDYRYVGNPYLLWERWYTRWAANYTMRVVSAESNMGTAFLYEDRPQHVEPLPALTGYAKKMLSTKSGDIVSMGTVWYKPVDAEFGKGYFKALKTIVGERPQMVSLSVINSKFLELTKSWLCNVKEAGFVPPNIYWVTLDEESKRALDASGTGRTVDISDALSAENMDAVNILYGQPAYWKLMLMRTRLIRDLLDRGIDVFLFETDQVWLQDPFKYMKRELNAGSDMVGTLDSQHNVAGNTILLRSVMSTRRMWSEVYHRFKMSYDDKEIEGKAIHSETFVAHDQYQLSALLLFDSEFTQDYPVALGLLNAQLFVGGSWYTGMYSTEDAKRPVIINNNFISGAERKKARAIVFGHWFLKEDRETCDTASVRRAVRYEFSRLPGRWWAQKQRRMIVSAG